MRSDYVLLTVFEYSTEAQLLKSKLDSEGVTSMLMDEKTIDADPLISQAIGGVKVLVHEKDSDKAIKIFNTVREYEKDQKGNPIPCPNCDATTILVAPPQRRTLFFMLFPFFEKRKLICNECKTIF